MHLLNVHTLQLETFYQAEVPSYAILSHTWVKDEVSFAEIQNPMSPTISNKAGLDKIRRACQEAKSSRYNYVWVDTCCIDKSSSAELTESINSMYKWYEDAGICYAYLSDVSKAHFDVQFPRSRWFTRGWTLQELLAPDNVVFYDQDWCTLGTKHDLASRISEVTGIDEIALLGGSVHEYSGGSGVGQFCVAKRMSWASGRKTTRVEDTAYCLLGIMNVSMPLLYGEGERAFLRLQEEIIKSCNDDSILAWGLDVDSSDPLGLVPVEVEKSLDRGGDYGILARSPKDFKNCGNLEYAAASAAPFMMTNLGLQIELPLVDLFLPGIPPSLQRQVPGWVGMLGCSEHGGSNFLGIVLCPASAGDRNSVEVQRAAYGYDSFKKHTVRIGPRAAWQAVRRKITITQQHEARIARDFSTGVRHTIINESQTLLDAGYSVSHASEIHLSGVMLSTQTWGTWDSTSKVLTIPRKYERDILRVEFKKQDGEPDAEFSVFIRSSRALVRRGSTFSRKEMRGFRDIMDTLEGKRENDEPDLILKGNSGREYRTVVTVKEKEICFSRILEVDVDAIPLSISPGLAQAGSG
jgi:hypothetical protein